MNLQTHEHAGVLTVSVSGPIDHVTSEEFASALDESLKNHPGQPPKVVLDFSDVTYISSAGLRILMLVSRRLKGQAGALVVARLNALIQEVFSISRFNLIVPTYPTIEAARTALGG
ncbi:MAG: STAS domain-containing protein [Dechloromonas sp.]|nr:STAS domain-containing protein [Dechloromonas sp.]